MSDIDFYSCTVTDCAAEISYPEDMLYAHPETGDPYCENCKGEECIEEYIPWKSPKTLRIEELEARVKELEKSRANLRKRFNDLRKTSSKWGITK